MNETKRRIVAAGILSAYLVAILLLLFGKSQLTFSLLLLGQICGVLAITSLGVQSVLSARYKFLERGVGQDRLMRWHGNDARFLVALVIIHPALVMASYLTQGLTFLGVIETYTVFHFLGIAAQLLIFFVAITSIYTSQLKLKHEAWEMLHKLVYLISSLSLIHSLKIGSDLINRSPIFYWWTLILLIIVATAIFRYLIRPSFKKHYRVVENKFETANVRTIGVEPVSHSGFSFMPGQFAYVTFLSKTLPSEEHHFTIASTPTDDGRLSFSIKSLGDFTSLIEQILIGDTVLVDGPYGVCTNVNLPGPFVFLAGGIGITPIMSMLRAHRQQPDRKPTTLIYANKKRADIVFKSELDEMASEGWLKLVYILSEEELPGFVHGLINEEIIKKNVKEITKPYYFIVGPPKMMELSDSILRSIGVKRNRIVSEKFALK